MPLTHRTTASPNVTFVAVGDLQLGDSPNTVGYGFFSRYGKIPIQSLFTDILPALQDTDVLFGNLETMLVPARLGETRQSALQLRGTLAFADGLRRAGFTILNVANNHASQHGADTFHATVAEVRRQGIAVCGVRGTNDWTSEPALFTHRGHSIGVLGYCLRPRQYAQDVPPYAEGTPAQICADVARLRATGVRVVVSLHWGEEFVSQPSEEEVALGHSIIDAGAAAVIGHHPHVVRQVELYNDGVIAHSLGNLLGDMTWYRPFRRGAIIRFTLGPDAVTDVQATSTYLRDDYRPALDPNENDLVVGAEALPAMPTDEYARAIDDTIFKQRLAAYRYALLNIHRVPFVLLSQLIRQTVRNKITGLLSRR